MKYLSTRGSKRIVSGAQAIIDGIAEDGGLYVPESFPAVSEKELKELALLEYPELSATILGKFLPEFSYEDLLKAAKEAAEKFEDGLPAPLYKVNEQAFFLELWHGPTCAFKDLALTVLPSLMSMAKKKLGLKEKLLILVATSGDTGKAALAGFQDAPGTKVGVFYPAHGVSRMQELQMTTQEGSNVGVWGINGNFDEAQTTLKKLFTDKDFISTVKKSGYLLSSANSINLGRLLPQVVYYFSAYFSMVGAEELTFGEPLNFAVPTGNFGNILAAYYAKRMGLPVGKLICASNANNILTDFFDVGVYDTDRQFVKTISPSMDILISSNLERLLYEITGRSAERTAALMAALKDNKKYEINTAELKALKEDFYGDMADDAETREAISNLMAADDYICDPHTGVACTCYDNYIAETHDESKAVIISTASPFKFADDVLTALGINKAKTLEKSLQKLTEATALPVPESLDGLVNKIVRFDEVIFADEAAAAVEAFIKK